MNYKGYSILNESKKSKDVTVIFLSARAKSTKKDSNIKFSNIVIKTELPDIRPDFLKIDVE